MEYVWHMHGICVARYGGIGEGACAQLPSFRNSGNDPPGPTTQVSSGAAQNLPAKHAGVHNHGGCTTSPDSKHYTIQEYKQGCMFALLLYCFA